MLSDGGGRADALAGSSNTLPPLDGEGRGRGSFDRHAVDERIK
jgi:hypothetical protein